MMILNPLFLMIAKTLYNSQTQLCCGGTIHDVTALKLPVCCGNLVYGYEESACCYDNDQPLVLAFPADGITSYDCCEDPKTHVAVLYNRATQYCCDGNIIDRPYRFGSYDCCNGHLYDVENQYCCGGKQLYDRATQTCCATYGILDNGDYGLIAYQVSTTSGNSTSCCSLRTYDKTKEACCNDVIVPLPEGPTSTTHWCCGDKIYEYGQQICCTTWKYSDKRKSILTGVAIHGKSSSSHQSCCGLEIYDEKESICCNGKIIPRPTGIRKGDWLTCCGEKVITNYANQTCHKDKIYQTEVDKTQVCGDELYDVRTQFCCGEMLYYKEDELQCCQSADTIYNPLTELCCATTVEPLFSGDLYAGNDACCAV